MKQKTKPNLPLKRLTFSIMLACSLYSVPGVYAETPEDTTNTGEHTAYEVQPNDTLSAIVIQHYPRYANRPAIMQAILEANATAFINQDIHRLIVGKTLNLPDASTIPAVNQLPEPPTVVPPAQVQTPAQEQAGTSSASPDMAARLATLEQQRTELEARLKALETENAALKEQIAEFEQEKTARDAELKRLEEQLQALQNATPQDGSTTAEDTQAQIDYLQEQLGILDEENIKLSEELDKAQKALANSTQTTESLRSELETLRTENTSLLNDLQQTRAVSDVKLGEGSESGFSVWPWLLALLLAPLAWWFGRRSRQETVTTTAPRNEAATATDDTVSNDAGVKPVSTAHDAATITTPITHGEDSDENAVAGEETLPDVPDVALKLDMARAYLDLRDADAANEILQEVLREGGTQQRQEAREILSFI